MFALNGGTWPGSDCYRDVVFVLHLVLSVSELSTTDEASP